LLAIDTEQFAFPTTFQVARAYTFLCTEETHAKRLEPFFPKKRLMDNMAQGLYLPQEEAISRFHFGLQKEHLPRAFRTTEEKSSPRVEDVL
jgi:hypothetical protein